MAITHAAVASPKHHRTTHPQARASRANRAPAPPPPPVSYFLAANPHVPLAITNGNLIRSAVSEAERGRRCGARSRWRVPASRWNAIDAWGQLVGSYVVGGFDDYDVTGCAELSFAGAPRGNGALLFVSADSAWTPSPSVRWTPAPAEAHAFEAALSDVVRGHAQRNMMRECTEIHDEVRFFEVRTGTATQRFAVGGRNGGYLVASLAADGSWSRDLAKSEPVRAPDFTMCYRPVAVFDMNGDGVPEIVVRESEPASWGDFVLMRSLTGHWQVVATSPGGSTA
jgi:hypothetical protein